MALERHGVRGKIAILLWFQSSFPDSQSCRVRPGIISALFRLRADRPQRGAGRAAGPATGQRMKSYAAIFAVYVLVGGMSGVVLSGAAAAEDLASTVGAVTIDPIFYHLLDQ